MANDADMSGWLDLLHSSSNLLEQAGLSAQFPPLLVPLSSFSSNLILLDKRCNLIPLVAKSDFAAVYDAGVRLMLLSYQRNLDQLEALSKKLKAKTLRSEAPFQSIAATRLLAREGINAEQLARDLKSFELKTTYVFPAEDSTVEEYLQQEHEMAKLSAIQQAQKDNLRSFNDHMMKVLEVSVAKERGDEGESCGLQGMALPPAVPAPHIAGESWVTLLQQACYNLLYGPTTEEEIDFQSQYATAWENDVVHMFENAAVMSMARRDLEIARKRLAAEERKKQLQVLEGQEWAHLIQQRHYLERQLIQATATNRVVAAEIAVEKAVWAKNAMEDEMAKLRVERDAAVDAEITTKQELETAKAGSSTAQEMAKVESSKLKQERDAAVAEAAWVRQELEQLRVGIFIDQQAHEMEGCVLKAMVANTLEEATRAEQQASELELQVTWLQTEAAETQDERDALLTEIEAVKQVFGLAGEDVQTVACEVVDAVAAQGDFAKDVAAMRKSRQVMAALREMALDLKITMAVAPSPVEDSRALKRLEIQVRLLMEKKSTAEREVSRLRETTARLLSSLETMVPKVSANAAMARHESVVLRVGALRCLEQLKQHLACFDVVLDTYDFDFDLLDACDIPIPGVTFSEAGASSQSKG